MKACKQVFQAELLCANFTRLAKIHIPWKEKQTSCMYFIFFFFFFAVAQRSAYFNSACMCDGIVSPQVLCLSIQKTQSRSVNSHGQTGTQTRSTLVSRPSKTSKPRQIMVLRVGFYQYAGYNSFYYQRMQLKMCIVPLSNSQ